jgi:hypothetical protein
MQYQSGQEVVLKGLALQTYDRIPGVNVYNYERGTSFNQLNIEQQGNFMECRYRGIECGQ